MKPHTPCRGQRGVTLIIALVMLTVLGLLAALAVKAGAMNLRVLGNMQARQQVLSVAQTALETTLSSPEFSQQPATVAARAIPVDIDGDGVADLSAQLSPAPACYRLRVVKMAELDAAVETDRLCMKSSSAANAGIDTGSATGGDSMCADSEWRLRATVNDAATGASVAVNQGVSLRGLVTDAVNACP